MTHDRPRIRYVIGRCIEFPHEHIRHFIEGRLGNSKIDFPTQFALQ
jgi:hypothetical protein